MNWNTNSASQLGTYAAEGDNPPRTLSAETFVDNLSLGEPSPLVSYDIGTKTCLVFAHYQGSDLKVEAIATDYSHVFSETTALDPYDDTFTCIKYCSSQNWLFVGMNNNLYLFDSQTGDFLHAFAISPVRDVYETTTGEIVASLGAEFHLLEYDIQSEEYTSTLLWSDTNGVNTHVRGYWAPEDILVMGDNQSGGSLTKLIGYSLLDGTQKWNLTFPYTRNLKIWGLDHSGYLYFTYLEGVSGNYGVAYSKLFKLNSSNGQTVWECDLTDYEVPYVGITEYGYPNGELVVLGPAGSPSPWAAISDVSLPEPPENANPGDLVVPVVLTGPPELDVSSVTICEDALHIVHSGIESEHPFTRHARLLTVNPMNGQVTKTLLSCQGEQTSTACISANDGGGSWFFANQEFSYIASQQSIFGRMLTLSGVSVDPQSVLVKLDDLESSNLPADLSAFQRACIVDGSIYYPWWNTSSSNYEINVIGLPYVDDRDERNCLKDDCIEKVTTFGHNSFRFGNLAFKGYIYNSPPASMAYGWQLSDYKKVEERLNGDLVYHTGTGMYERWFQVNGEFLPAHPDNYIKAVKNSNGTYSLTHPDGSIMNFNGDHRLQTWVDSNNNTTTYTYEATGDKRLLSIDDGEGRETNFNYGSRTDGQPVSVSSHSSSGGPRVTLYEYYPNEDPNKNRLWKITNPEGEVTEFIYNDDGRLLRIKDARGQIAREYSYHDDGKVKAVTFYGQTRTTYNYNDSEKSVTTVTQDLTDPSSTARETVVVYDEYHNVIEQRVRIDATEWNVTRSYYESPYSPYLLTKEISPNGAITSYSYNARGKLKETVDPEGNRTSFGYMSEINPSHAVQDLVVRVDRPFVSLLSRPRTTFHYDSNGNLTRSVDSLGNEINYQYAADGRLLEIEDQLGHATKFVYQGQAHDGSFRHLEEVRIPINNVGGYRTIEYDFDDFDNLRELKDGLGHSTDFTYDKLDRLLSTTDAEGATTTFHYDNGLMDFSTLPANQASGAEPRQATFIRDTVGRILESRFSDSVSSDVLRVAYEYTGFSELKSLSRVKGFQTHSYSYSYDRLGRPVSATDPRGKTANLAYEPFCVGQAATSARGVRSRTDYNLRCLPTMITTGDPGSSELDVTNTREVRTFEYDNLGRLIKTTQPPLENVGSSTYGVAHYGVAPYGTGELTDSGERLFEYDLLDRLTKLTFENGEELHYSYDEAGYLTGLTDPGGKETLYEYRPDGLLKTVTVKREGGSDRVFRYDYDLAGRMTRLEYPAETGIKLYFDDGSGGSGWSPTGRLKHMRYEINDAPHRSFEFDYDNSGNRVLSIETGTSGTVVHKYSYDWLDRLIKVEKGTTLSNVVPVAVYAYDESDNPTLLELPQDIVEFVYTYNEDCSPATRVKRDSNTSAVLFTENFVNDDDGNLISRTRSDSSLTVYYVWDDFNKLIEVSSAMAGTPTNDYKQQSRYGVNGLRRHKKAKDGKITRDFAESLTPAFARSQSEQVSYIRGHQILGFEQNGKSYYFLTDALGSVRDIIGYNESTSQWDVLQQYRYDERGNHLPGSGNGSVSSPKTFVGGLSVNDDTPDSGLYLMGHRHYDPGIGRFLSRDPIGFAGGLNLYSYTNSSVSSVDPDGLRSLDPVNLAFRFARGAIVGAGASLALIGLASLGTAGAAIAATAGVALLGIGLASTAAAILTGNFTIGDAAEMAGGVAGGGLTTRGIGRFSESRTQVLKNPCPPNSLTFSSSDEIFSNPNILRNASPARVREFFQGQPGWEVGPMRQGRSAGSGLSIRELNSARTNYTDKYIQWHPGTSRHFYGDPYWKVSIGNRKPERIPSFGGELDGR